ncbi:hypothetical protein B296_00005915 [Ensete ventricosum]|uniref:3-dehydroquinate synthase domain-containing protein n=1 Tax=Ensete ventricosum TaxID=4639 RepID=A0A427AQ24_ENSVE|nr:hypothetical protein B296_00005915 [Ensete ventricosum]
MATSSTPSINSAVCPSADISVAPRRSLFPATASFSPRRLDLRPLSSSLPPGRFKAPAPISARSRSRTSACASAVTEDATKRADSRVSTVVDVDLGSRSYPIYIGSGLLDEPDLLQSVLVVTNTTIAPLYLDKVVKALTHGNEKVTVESVILPDGEKYKNMVGA